LSIGKLIKNNTIPRQSLPGMAGRSLRAKFYTQRITNTVKISNLVIRSFFTSADAAFLFVNANLFMITIILKFSGKVNDLFGHFGLLEEKIYLCIVEIFN
jgi:hypothetical protein